MSAHPGVDHFSAKLAFKRSPAIFSVATAACIIVQQCHDRVGHALEVLGAIAETALASFYQALGLSFETGNNRHSASHILIYLIRQALKSRPCVAQEAQPRATHEIVKLRLAKPSGID